MDVIDEARVRLKRQLDQSVDLFKRILEGNRE